MKDNIFEEDTHVFIIRTWNERREIAGALPKWRGTIEHVPSGERQSLQKVEDICLFIRPYLLEEPVPIKSHRRILSWLDQRLRRDDTKSISNE